MIACIEAGEHIATYLFLIVALLFVAAVVVVLIRGIRNGDL